MVPKIVRKLLIGSMGMEDIGYDSVCFGVVYIPKGFILLVLVWNMYLGLP